MFDDLPLVAIEVIDQGEMQPSPPADKPDQAEVAALPRPEDARAVEAVFAEEQEQSTAAGLIGLHASTVFLSELAVRASEREKDEERPRRLGEPEEEEDEE